jgi:hypothetical protein
MKTINFIIFTFILTIQTFNAQNKQINNAVNFAKIINYNVVVKDTSTLKYNLTQYDSLEPIFGIVEHGATQYIDPISYKQFLNIIRKYLNDKNAFAINNYGKKVNPVELKKQTIYCDSTDNFLIDEFGNEQISRVGYCDSTLMFESNTILNFTETWSIDSKTYEIKKEVLAYTLMYWDIKREFYRQFLTVYKNKDAFDFINSLTR